jgi:uncharacterized membrane-anchored protein YjiN (DUF445 family)
MTKDFVDKLKNHPDYEKTIDEVIENRFDKGIMEKAIKKAKKRSQAEAIYVLLKLRK